MPVPHVLTKYYELNLVDRTIINIVEKLQGELTLSEINQVKVMASVQSGIESYREETAKKNSQSLRSEEHKSHILGKHLEEKFGPRPARTHAHAIVAGKHPLAAAIRLIMSKLKIGIDDVDNGCWLPENIAATPHPAMPKAPPHSRIHRYNYYFWINSLLSSHRQADAFRNRLKLISQMLYTGNMPEYVMLPKGKDLP